MNDKKKAIFGVGWTTISAAFTMAAQILRVVILTRFLSKSDFGVVAIVNVVIGLCTTFADLGFASVIMYKQKIEKKEFSTLFWTQLLVFIFIYLILFSCAGLFSRFYNEPTLSVLIPISALSIVFLSMGKLYDSILQKRYEFKTLAIRNIIASIISMLLAWYLAYLGYGVYSLVVSTLFQLFFYNLWNLLAGYKLQQICFHLSFNKEIVCLIKMGLYQTYTRVLDFLSTKIDVLMIGSYFGTEVLGVYDLAKELVQKIINFIKTVVSSVALPFLSNGNSEDKVVVSRFMLITKVVAYVCFPICIITVVFSKPIITIMYGEKFISAYPIVAVFALMTGVNSIASFFDMLGIAKGRTDLNFLNTLIRVICTIPIILICCQISVIAVSIGHFLLSIMLFIVMWHIIPKRTYNLSFREYYRQFNCILYILLPFSIIFYCAKALLFEHYCQETILNNLICFIIYIVLLSVIAYFGLKQDVLKLVNVLKIKK